MKQLYPDWTYVKEQTSRKLDVYKNAEIILFATEHLNHGLFEQVMNNKPDSAKVWYVHKTNVKACTEEIYEQYLNLKK